MQFAAHDIDVTSGTLQTFQLNEVAPNEVAQEGAPCVSHVGRHKYGFECVLGYSQVQSITLRSLSLGSTSAL